MRTSRTSGSRWWYAPTATRCTNSRTYSTARDEAQTSRLCSRRKSSSWWGREMRLRTTRQESHAQADSVVMDTWRFDASTAGIFCELESLEIEIKSKPLRHAVAQLRTRKSAVVRWWYLCMDRFCRKLLVWCMGVATEMSEHGCDGIISRKPSCGLHWSRFVSSPRSCACADHWLCVTFSTYHHDKNGPKFEFCAIMNAKHVSTERLFFSRNDHFWVVTWWLIIAATITDFWSCQVQNDSQLLFYFLAKNFLRFLLQHLQTTLKISTFLASISLVFSDSRISKKSSRNQCCQACVPCVCLFEMTFFPLLSRRTNVCNTLPQDEFFFFGGGGGGGGGGEACPIIIMQSNLWNTITEGTGKKWSWFPVHGLNFLFTYAPHGRKLLSNRKKKKTCT